MFYVNRTTELFASNRNLSQIEQNAVLVPNFLPSDGRPPLANNKFDEPFFPLSHVVF